VCQQQESCAQCALADSKYRVTLVNLMIRTTPMEEKLLCQRDFGEKYVKKSLIIYYLDKLLHPEGQNC
jgi:hypothetical protein